MLGSHWVYLRVSCNKVLMNEIIGKVFTGNNSGPIRVLCADEITVLYEPISPFGWYFANTKTANFFGFPTDYFKANFVILFDQIAYSAEDIDRFFPLLPIRLLRYTNVFWPDESHNSLEEFKNICLSLNIDTDDNIVLNTPEVYLNPTSALGRIYNGPLIKSNKKEGFTTEELLFHAFSIQSKYIKPNQTTIQYQRYGPIHSGIGLYRSGIRSNKPSYYLAAYHDQAENTLRAEKVHK